MGLRRLTMGVCRARRDGVRCGNAGIPISDHTLCAPCRGSLGPHTSVRCDCCGQAAGSAGIATWAAIGRWTMVCPHCVPAIGALPVSPHCDNCQEPASRVTADGSNSCSDCMDSFSQTRVWLARAQSLVSRAQHRMGITPLTPELERRLWLHAADLWAAGGTFCGNAVTWHSICELVAGWWRSHGVLPTHSGLTAAVDRYKPAWTATPPPPPPRKQGTLLQHGFTGRQLAVRRPLYRPQPATRHRSPTPAPPPAAAQQAHLPPAAADLARTHQPPPVRSPPTLARPATAAPPAILRRRDRPPSRRRRPTSPTARSLPPARGAPPSPPPRLDPPPCPSAGTRPRLHPRSDTATREPD